MPGENDIQVLPTDGFTDFKDLEDEAFSDEEQNIPESKKLETEEDNLDDSNDDTQESDQDGDQLQVQDSDSTDMDNSDAEKMESNKNDDTNKRDEYMEKYSKSVQRRINKEVRQREELKSENAAMRERLERLEQSFQQQESDKQHDKEQSDYDVLTNRIRNATSMKQQLLEEGDYTELAKVDDDIVQMRIYQSKLEDKINQRKQEEKNAQTQQYQQAPQYQQNQQYQQPQQYTDQYAQQQQQQAPVEIPDVQRTWITNNDRYGKDKAYSQYVDTMYDQLMEEGFDPEDESTYEELNSRTGSQVQFRAANQQQQQQPQQQQQRRQAAPAPNSSRAQPQTSKRSGRLTEADKINMRNWGLDVNNESVRKEWLRNKGNR